jgi:hypothetical protein
VPTYALWFATMSFEILLLGRGCYTRLIARFPLFYAYVLFVLLQSLARFSVYHWLPQRYMECYWYSEFIGVIVGCGVLFEIYRKGLAPYPGTARVARNVLALVFVAAAGKALAASLRGPMWWPARTTAVLERNLRAVQAFAVLGLVILLVAYSIPLGRNLRGIVMGYALFIATSLGNLAILAAPGNELQHVWSYSQQVFYLLVLCIWTVSLWTYSPLPHLPAASGVAQPYGAVEQKTRERFKRIRPYFGKTEDR